LIKFRMTESYKGHANYDLDKLLKDSFVIKHYAEKVSTLIF